jgi:anti-sigma B factor antagonist
MPTDLTASGVFSLPTTLTADVRLGATGVNVTLRGEVDLHSAPVLREHLRAAVDQGEARVIVHLDGVRFIDSTGLGILVGAHKAQRAAGHSLELVCSRPRLLRILELTGLHRVLTVHDGTPR